MTDSEWLKNAQAEVNLKIAAGILPKGAEVAVCGTPGCTHWAHALGEK